MLKRFLLFLLLSIALPGWAMAATYYVAQTAAGDGTGSSYANRAAVATFNAGTGNFANLAGDTVYFSGAITTTIVVPNSGTAGNYITLDGDDGVNTAASITRSSGNSIYSIAKDYLIIRDFTITGGDEGIFFATTGSDGSQHIQVINNTISNIVNRPIFFNNDQPNQDLAWYGIIGDDGDGALEAGETLVCNGWISVTNNTIINPGNNTAGYGIKVDGAHDVYIANNNIYGDSLDWGITGISGHGCRNFLIEYNTVHNMNDSQAEVGLTNGKGGYNIVIRFNKVYGNYSREGSVYITAGISIWGDTKYVYAYGNLIYGNMFGLTVGSETGPVSAGCGDSIYPQYIYVFSNIVYENFYTGIAIGSTANCSGPVSPPNPAKDVYIYNNTVVRNGGWNEDWDESYLDAFLYSSNILVGISEDLTMKNNLIIEGRPYKTNYVQVISSGTTYPSDTIAIDDNQYYWPGQSSAFALKATQANFAAWQAATYDTNGIEADPLFYNDSTDDFRILGTSDAIDTATTITPINAVIPIIDGAGVDRTVTITLAEALDPVNTDWTTTPPTVSIVMRSTWDRGAYEMEGGVNYPNGTIDTPASGTTLTTGSAYSVLGTAESGTAPYTYAWSFGGAFVAYDAGTEYNTGSTVTYGGSTWRSLQDTHTGNTPSEGAFWTRIDNDEDPCPDAAKCIFATANTFNITFTVTDNAALVDSSPGGVVVTVAGSGYTCTSIVSQLTHDGYWNVTAPIGQKISFADHPGPLCSAKVRLYLNTLAPTAHLEVWPTGDMTGSQVGGDSSSVVVSAATPGELYEFTWSTDYPTPVADYWLFVVSDGGGTFSIRAADDETSYEDSPDGETDYNLWRSGAELWNPSDMVFELYQRAGSAPPASQTCDLTVDQTSHDGYWPVRSTVAQKMKYATNPGPICKAYVQVYYNTGSPYGHLEVWTTADMSGSQIGGDSDNCAVVTDATPGAMYLFNWSSNYPTPTGDYWLHIVDSGAGGTWSVRLTTDPTDYVDTNYDFYDDTAEAGNYDLSFKLYELSTTPYVVQSVESSLPSATLAEGESTGTFTVTFNGLLDWDEGTGTISLVLNNTAGDDPSVRIATASGTDSQTLTFSALTIPAGMTATDLDAVSIALTGDAYIYNADTTASATLTLPTGATSGSLASNSAIVVDTAAPTVAYIKGYDAGECPTCTEDGTITTAGTTVRIYAKISEAVGDASGAPDFPRVLLATLPTNRYATFESRSGQIVTMIYVTQIGDRIADLDYVATDSLDMGTGGELKDVAGNDLTTTLAEPAAANSLGANSAIVINVPFTAGVPLDIGASGVYATITAAQAAITLSSDDNLRVGTITDTPNAGAAGTAGHPITVTFADSDTVATGAWTLDENYWTINGAGGSIVGDVTVTGTNVTIDRVKHNSTVTLGVDSIHSNSLIPTGDTLSIPEGATGVTVYNDTIAGTLTVAETCALMKNLIVVAADLSGVGAGETATFTNCVFTQSQATIEGTLGVDGTAVFTNCLFEKSTASMFTDAGSGDYTLIAGSSPIDAGVDLGDTYDEDLSANDHDDNGYPVQAVNVLPANGVTKVARKPLLTSDTFGGIAGAWDAGCYSFVASAHSASQWQVCSDALCSSVVWDSGEDASNLLSVDVTDRLDAKTIYYFRVRHYTDAGAGAWSEITSFTTKKAVKGSMIFGVPPFMFFEN